MFYLGASQIKSEVRESTGANSRPWTALVWCIPLLGPWAANPLGISTINELLYVLVSHRGRDRPYIVAAVWCIMRYQSCCRLLSPGATRSSLSIT